MPGMINWLSVVANSFWIVGLAIMLAGASYHLWLADQLNRPVRQQLSGAPFLRVAVAGLLLVGIGLALTADGPWQLVPAAALSLLCLFTLLALFRRPD